MSFNTFIFKNYEIDPNDSTVKLHYSYDHQLNFTETLTWNRPLSNVEQIEPALQLLHLVLGISYFKAYLAPNISLPDYDLTDDQADFLNALYTNGLGEFLYKSDLDFSDIAKFTASVDGAPQIETSKQLSGVLLPVSGGKDSLLSAEILLSDRVEFTPLHITTTGKYPAVLDQFGQPPIIVKRQIDSELIKANKTDAFNGHVPFSAIIDSILLVAATMFDFRDIVLSHENSANEATTVYKGREINHQFSKTVEFNNLLQAYVHRHINPKLNIFSLLSALTELEINELFVKNGLFNKYQGLWSSCNRANYKLGHDNQKLFWCGECSKCANAFLLLAPFVDKQTLIDMFDGKNLLADNNLTATFNSLLGQSEAKPFECVAEINELRQAMKLLQDSNDWPEATSYPVVSLPAPSFITIHPAIPDEYSKLVEKFLH